VARATSRGPRSGAAKCARKPRDPRSIRCVREDLFHLQQAPHVVVERQRGEGRSQWCLGERATFRGTSRRHTGRSAYDPPPFDSFGRSVTVTVVVQENNSRAAFVAEHATVVVPIRN
jgi:hypothetical protein